MSIHYFSYSDETSDKNRQGIKCLFVSWDFIDKGHCIGSKKQAGKEVALSHVAMYPNTTKTHYTKGIDESWMENK